MPRKKKEKVEVDSGVEKREENGLTIYTHHLDAGYKAEVVQDTPQTLGYNDKSKEISLPALWKWKLFDPEGKWIAHGRSLRVENCLRDAYAAMDKHLASRPGKHTWTKSARPSHVVDPRFYKVHVLGAYSADKIANYTPGSDKSVPVHAFHYEGKPYTSTGGSGVPGKNTSDAWELVPLEEYRGEPVTYSEVLREVDEKKRDRDSFYEGIVVRTGRKRWAMSRPVLFVAYVKEEAQEPVREEPAPSTQQPLEEEKQEVEEGIAPLLLDLQQARTLPLVRKVGVEHVHRILARRKRHVLVERRRQAAA